MSLIINLIAAAIIIGLISGVIWAIRSEMRDYNKGVCPKCGKPWRYIGSDSQGGRGYTCDGCANGIWVSYPFVDGGGKNA